MSEPRRPYDRSSDYGDRPRERRPAATGERPVRSTAGRPSASAGRSYSTGTRPAQTRTGTTARSPQRPAGNARSAYDPQRRPARPQSRPAAQRSNDHYGSRSHRTASRKSNEALKFCGVVVLLALIIVLAVIQIRSTKDQIRMAENNATPVPQDVTLAQNVDTVQTEQPAATQVPVEQPPVEQIPIQTPAAEPTAQPIEIVSSEPTQNNGVASFGTAAAGLKSVRFRFIGDIMVTTSQLASSYQGGTFDFSNEFAYVRPYMQNADFTIANLETTIGKYKNSNYSGYPQFNSPESLLGDLKNCGIDMFTLCNNHMLDRWFDGMKNTVGWVEEYGFQHVGAYRTKAERNGVKIIEINGIKFGFLAYTTSTNTMEDRGCDPAVKEYAVPYFSRADIEADVKRLRSAGAEVVICFPHWGAEYIREPDENQTYYAKKLYQAGVDIIIGSHSHMVQPMGFKTITTTSGDSKEVFLMYSMGNFISNMTVKHTDSGVILELTVQEQNDGSYRVENVGIVPLYTWTYGAKDKETCITLPSGDFLKNAPDGMSSGSWSRMKETYNEITSLLGSVGRVLNK